MSRRINHQEIVQKALDGKVVDFAAIGKVVAELGPALSLADEPWEGFCGTMRFFIRFYVINPGFGGVLPVEDLAALRTATVESRA